VASRIEREFVEIPNLAITEAQAVRLWNLDHAICQRALEHLVDARVLARTGDGRYVSSGREYSNGSAPHARG
jgi:hypothetical protein